MRFVLLTLPCLIATAALARAQVVVGSDVIRRSQFDSASGKVYIYAGGFLPSGVPVRAIN
jgi:hypothetical protein